eukprot:3504615-Pyramimonas_sp.AAC.1
MHNRSSQGLLSALLLKAQPHSKRSRELPHSQSQDRLARVRVRRRHARGSRPLAGSPRDRTRPSGRALAAGRGFKRRNAQRAGSAQRSATRAAPTSRCNIGNARRETRRGGRQPGRPPARGCRPSQTKVTKQRARELKQ